MNRDVIYRKVGRRYVPIGDWEERGLDYLPFGQYLVTVSPGSQRLRTLMTPDFAALQAALDVCESAMLDALRKAGERRQVGAQNQPLTALHRKAYEAYCAVLKTDEAWLCQERKSAHDVIDALRDELLKHMGAK